MDHQVLMEKLKIYLRENNISKIICSYINIQYEPTFFEVARELNIKYLSTTKFCTGLQLVNIGVSIGDIASHWAGAATVTPLLSSILLIFMKLYASFTVANASIKDERVFSAYLSIPKTFNIFL